MEPQTEQSEPYIVNGSGYHFGGDEYGLPEMSAYEAQDPEGRTGFIVHVDDGDYAGMSVFFSKQDEYNLRFDICTMPEYNDEIDSEVIKEISQNMISKIVEDYPQRLH